MRSVAVLTPTTPRVRPHGGRSIAYPVRVRSTIPALLLVLGCGPTVVPQGGTGEGSSSSASAVDSSSTTADSASDGFADSTSGELDDPSGPCPDPIPGVTMLWCGAVDVEEGPLATDGTWIYFDTEDESLWRVLLSGTDDQGLAGPLGDLHDLEVVDGRVYFTAFFAGTAGSVPVEGGPVQLLSDTLFKPSSLAIGSGYAFVTQYESGLSLMRYALDTGEAEELYPDLEEAGLAFLDGTSLFFATDVNSGNNPTPVWRGNIMGGPLQLVIDPSVVVEHIVKEGSTLWWTRYLPDDSGIMRTELEDPPITTTVLQASAHPLDLTLTPDRVYWREHVYNGVEPYHECIQSITREGTDLRLHLAADQVGPVLATPDGIVSTIRIGEAEDPTRRQAVIRLDP